MPRETIPQEVREIDRGRAGVSALRHGEQLAYQPVQAAELYQHVADSLLAPAVLAAAPQQSGYGFSCATPAVTRPRLVNRSARAARSVMVSASRRATTRRFPATNARATEKIGCRLGCPDAIGKEIMRTGLRHLLQER